MTLVQPRPDEPGRSSPSSSTCTATATGDLGALEGRAWDAVVDPSGYVPARRPARRPQLLRETPLYLLRLLSISYYADYREPRVEDDPPEQLADEHPADRLLEDYANYGALKALCEQEVEQTSSATARSSSGPG